MDPKSGLHLRLSSTDQIHIQGYIFLDIDCHGRHGHHNSECRSFVSNLAALLPLSVRKLCWSTGKAFLSSLGGRAYS